MSFAASYDETVWMLGWVGVTILAACAVLGGLGFAVLVWLWR